MNCSAKFAQQDLHCKFRSAIVLQLVVGKQVPEND